MNLILPEVFLWLKCHVLPDITKTVLDIIASLYIQDLDNIDKLIISTFNSYIDISKPLNNYIIRETYNRIYDNEIYGKYNNEILYSVTLMYDEYSTEFMQRSRFSICESNSKIKENIKNNMQDIYLCLYHHPYRTY